MRPKTSKPAKKYPKELMISKLSAEYASGLNVHSNIQPIPD